MTVLDVNVPFYTSRFPLTKTTAVCSLVSKVVDISYTSGRACNVPIYMIPFPFVALLFLKVEFWMITERVAVFAVPTKIHTAVSP